MSKVLVGDRLSFADIDLHDVMNFYTISLSIKYDVVREGYAIEITKQLTVKNDKLLQVIRLGRISKIGRTNIPNARVVSTSVGDSYKLFVELFPKIGNGNPAYAYKDPQDFYFNSGYPSLHTGFTNNLCWSFYRGGETILSINLENSEYHSHQKIVTMIPFFNTSSFSSSSGYIILEVDTLSEETEIKIGPLLRDYALKDFPSRVRFDPEVISGPPYIIESSMVEYAGPYNLDYSLVRHGRLQEELFLSRPIGTHSLIFELRLFRLFRCMYGMRSMSDMRLVCKETPKLTNFSSPTQPPKPVVDYEIESFSVDEDRIGMVYRLEEAQGFLFKMLVLDARRLLVYEGCEFRSKKQAKTKIQILLGPRFSYFFAGFDDRVDMCYVRLADPEEAVSVEAAQVVEVYSGSGVFSMNAILNRTDPKKDAHLTIISEVHKHSFTLFDGAVVDRNSINSGILFSASAASFKVCKLRRYSVYFSGESVYLQGEEGQIVKTYTSRKSEEVEVRLDGLVCLNDRLALLALTYRRKGGDEQHGLLELCDVEKPLTNRTMNQLITPMLKKFDEDQIYVLAEGNNLIIYDEQAKNAIVELGGTNAYIRAMQKSTDYELFTIYNIAKDGQGLVVRANITSIDSFKEFRFGKEVKVRSEKGNFAKVVGYYEPLSIDTVGHFWKVEVEKSTYDTIITNRFNRTTLPKGQDGEKNVVRDGPSSNGVVESGIVHDIIITDEEEGLNVYLKGGSLLITEHMVNRSFGVIEAGFRIKKFLNLKKRYTKGNEELFTLLFIFSKETKLYCNMGEINFTLDRSNNTVQKMQSKEYLEFRFEIEPSDEITVVWQDYSPLVVHLQKQKSGKLRVVWLACSTSGSVYIWEETNVMYFDTFEGKPGFLETSIMLVYAKEGKDSLTLVRFEGYPKCRIVKTNVIHTRHPNLYHKIKCVPDTKLPLTQFTCVFAGSQIFWLRLNIPQEGDPFVLKPKEFYSYKNMEVQQLEVFISPLPGTKEDFFIIKGKRFNSNESKSENTDSNHDGSGILYYSRSYEYARGGLNTYDFLTYDIKESEDFILKKKAVNGTERNVLVLLSHYGVEWFLIEEPTMHSIPVDKATLGNEILISMYGTEFLKFSSRYEGNDSTFEKRSGMILGLIVLIIIIFGVVSLVVLYFKRQQRLRRIAKRPFNISALQNTISDEANDRIDDEPIIKNRNRKNQEYYSDVDNEYIV